jgi:hypothetical protein
MGLSFCWVVPMGRKGRSMGIAPQRRNAMMAGLGRMRWPGRAA